MEPTEQVARPQRTKPYTAKDKVWRDHNGADVPVSRVNKLEKLTEERVFKLLNRAKKLNAELADLKAEFVNVNDELSDAFKEMHGADVKKTKGNKEWFTFDRSVCMEIDVQERVVFDATMISAAREKLNEYLGKTLSSNDEFIVDMVTKAFETTNGKLDSKRVFQLLGYRSKVKAVLFQEALDLIEKAIKREGSKNYMRVSEVLADGTRQHVQLNFSAI